MPLLSHTRSGGVLLASACLVLISPASSPGGLKISEFLASNEDSIKDEEGNRNDWIEILNPDATPVSLSGYYLTDDASKPRKWPFPAVTVPAGGTLVVWASEKDRRLPGAPLHTNFKLSTAGEYLGLLREDSLNPGQTVAADEYAPAYPPQYEDVSYGAAQQNTTTTLITTGTAARRFTPSSDALDVKEGLNPATWINTTFNDTTWTACTVPVGYGTDASDAYDALVTPGSASDTQTAMLSASRLSCYLRVPFTIANAGTLQYLTLRMKADDGFAAYLNGVPVPVADAVVPDALLWNTPARWEATDADSLTWKEYRLPAATVQNGTNLLAIHGVNASATNNDFLLLPELTAVSSDGTLTGERRYFLTPSPGTPNTNGTSNPGPILAEVPRTIVPPDTTAGPVNLPITAVVRPTAYPLAEVSLKWRIGYGAENTVTMKDDATGGDLLSGDGIYTGTITTSGLTAGAMLRWRVTATDSAPVPVTTTDPPYPDPADSPQYWGTIGALPAAASSQLPVLHWFTANTAGSATTAGGTGSIYYNGEFYDNVRFSLHGQSTAGFAKKSHDIDFNHDFHFRYAPDQKRVKDVNLLSNWADKSKLRTTLAYEAHRVAGQPALFAFPVRVQQNAAFYGIADMVEEGNEDYLERAGLDPDGALYKMYNTLDSAFSGIEKKTRQWEGNTDLNTLVTQLNTANALATRRRWGYDNVDLPNLVNYMAVSVLLMNNDQGHKNYYLYRDYADAQEWKLLPWDVDLTFGHTWTGTASPTFGAAYFDDHIDSVRGTRIGAANRLKSLLYDSPELNRLFVRRLRTLMDQWLLSATSTTGYFETRIATLLDQIDPPGLGNASDVYLDATRWGFWTMSTNTGAANTAVNRAVTDSLWPKYHPREMARRITDPTANISPYPSSASYSGLVNTDTRPSFLPGRRTALYGGGASALSGSDAIPAAQPALPALVFGAMEVNPGAAGQDREYFTLRNNAGTSIDISGWTISGGPDYTFPGGTVIPPWTNGAENIGLLFVAKRPAAFRTRTTGPTAGQYCYTVGGYDGQLSARGSTLEFRKPDGTLVASTVTPPAPTALQNSLRISEIMYAPTAPNFSELAVNPVWKAGDFEYLELRNIGTSTLDLAGAAFTAGVDYVFPAGVTLAAGARLIIPASSAAFAARYDAGLTGVPARVTGEFTGDLDNSGERLTLVDATGEVVLDFRYEGSWFWPAGEGYSLTLTDSAATPWQEWGTASRWSVSGTVQGSPGTEGPAGPVVYNTWKFERFPAAQWDTPALSGSAADPDQDGCPNLMEYALNLNPTRSDINAAPSPSFVESGGRFYPAITFRRRTNTADLMYMPEAANSPGASLWSPLTVLHGSPLALENGMESVTFRSNTPLPDAQRLFMRLRVAALREIP